MRVSHVEVVWKKDPRRIAIVEGVTEIDGRGLELGLGRQMGKCDSESAVANEQGRRVVGIDLA